MLNNHGYTLIEIIVVFIIAVVLLTFILTGVVYFIIGSEIFTHGLKHVVESIWYGPTR